MLSVAFIFSDYAGEPKVTRRFRLVMMVIIKWKLETKSLHGKARMFSTWLDQPWVMINFPVSFFGCRWLLKQLWRSSGEISTFIDCQFLHISLLEQYSICQSPGTARSQTLPLQSLIAHDQNWSQQKPVESRYFGQQNMKRRGKPRRSTRENTLPNNFGATFKREVEWNGIIFELLSWSRLSTKRLKVKNWKVCAQFYGLRFRFRGWIWTI